MKQEPTPHKVLPYGKQTIEDDDIAAVIDVLKSDYLTTGPVTAQFEDAFSKEVEAPFAVAVNSGTSGLHLAMIALGIGADDAVIVPSVTFLASANCAEYVGADVVFADVNPKNGLMELEHIQKAYNEHTGKPIKAIILVHLNGQTTDIEAVSQFAKDNNLYLVEDACHALGGEFISKHQKTHKIGNSHYSDITMFSGHPVKTIAMGEAGILTTANEELYNTLKLARSHNMQKDPSQMLNKELAYDTDGSLNPWYYEMHEPGYNFRCSDIHCALGLSQIKKLKSFVQKRQLLVNTYLELLPDLSDFLAPIEYNNHGNFGWHLFPVLCNFDAMGLSRKALMNKLSEYKIYTQVHYIPVSSQPYYQNKYPDNNLPGAMEYYNHVLSLPLFPSMEIEDVQYVIKTLRDILHGQ